MNFYGGKTEEYRQSLGLSPRPQETEEYVNRLGFKPKRKSELFKENKIPKNYHYGRLQNYTPQQMKLHERGFNLTKKGSYLDRLAYGNEEAYQQMEAPALRQFSGLQGNIANRFSGAGMGGRKSSDFRNTQNAAASDFAQQLQANRLNLRRQAISDLSSLSNQLLNQRPYEQMLAPRGQKKESPWGPIAGTAAAAATAYASGGNPELTMAAYQGGNAVGSQI